MTKLNRRSFIRNSAVVAGGISLASPLAGLQARQIDKQAVGISSRYGPLYPTRDRSTGLALLKLPRGFRYASYGWTGDIMDDGTPTPARHDGMGVVAVSRDRKREIVLIRNHESGVNSVEDPLPPIRGAATVYDDWSLPAAGLTGFAGGTTALFFSRGRFTGSQATLGGTGTNCAGGLTPWGSWLTCEETSLRGSKIGAQDHGYVFEVPNPREAQASARPIKEMGFMRHEAAAIDPETGYVYLTEDAGPNSGIYRFRPQDNRPVLGALENGGTLEMLKVIDQDNADLRGVNTGDSFAVEWVEIENPDADFERMEAPAPGFPELEGKGKSGVYLQGEAQGAAQFSRMEGCWYQDQAIYMTDTNAGPAGRGVVWVLEPGAANGADKLSCLYASPSEEIMDAPDNITVNRRGGILICEDGGGHTNSQGIRRGTRMIGVERDGTSFEFAENNMNFSGAVPGHEQIQGDDYLGREFAGACFDPTGRYLFVNIQTPGVTFVITGPWARGSL